MRPGTVEPREHMPRWGCTHYKVVSRSILRPHTGVWDGNPSLLGTALPYTHQKNSSRLSLCTGSSGCTETPAAHTFHPNRTTLGNNPSHRYMAAPQHIDPIHRIPNPQDIPMSWRIAVVVKPCRYRQTRQMWPKKHKSFVFGKLEVN